MAEKIVTKSEYALHRKVRPETLSRYFKSGKLDESVLTPEKKIRVAKADRMLQERLAPLQQKSSKARFTADKEKVIKQAGIDNGISLAEGQRILTSYKAAREKLRYESEKGDLVKREEVEQSAFDCGRRTRDAMMNIPDRVSSILAAESKEQIIREILNDEIRQALTNLQHDKYGRGHYDQERESSID